MRLLIWIVPAAAQLIVDFSNISLEPGLLEGPKREKLSGNVGIKKPKLCDDSVQQYSGYIPFTGADGSKKQFFFWLFESRGKPSTDPLIMWLSGGPGCSSLLALFGENGPCSVTEDGKNTTRNPYSWTNYANVMWVDQPAETGFSEGSYVKDGQEGVKEDMFAFLQAFYKALPQYKKNQFYVTGESYAGHYIPAIASRIAQGGGEFEIPLAGLAIGNGLTNPEVQYKWYSQMAKDGGKSMGGTSIPAYKFDELTLKIMEEGPVCKAMIEYCNKGSDGFCQSAFLLCNTRSLAPYQLSGFNPYDVREKCKAPPLCYDFSHVDAFLNDPHVQAELGAHTAWTECSRVVNSFFQDDFMKGYHQLLPPLLKKGIKVLIYAGDADFICNWLGNKAWTRELEWNGKQGFDEADDQPVTLKGDEVGRLRSYNGLSFYQIYGAGHLVPMDKPEVALEMIKTFIAPEKEEEYVIFE